MWPMRTVQRWQMILFVSGLLMVGGFTGLYSSKRIGRSIEFITTGDRVPLNPENPEIEQPDDSELERPDDSEPERSEHSTPVTSLRSVKAPTYDRMWNDFHNVAFKDGKMIFYGMDATSFREVEAGFFQYDHYDGDIRKETQIVPVLIEEPLPLEQCTTYENLTAFFISPWVQNNAFHTQNDNLLPVFWNMWNASVLGDDNALYTFEQKFPGEQCAIFKTIHKMFAEVKEASVLRKGGPHCFRRIRWGCARGTLYRVPEYEEIMPPTLVDDYRSFLFQKYGVSVNRSDGRHDVPTVVHITRSSSDFRHIINAAELEKEFTSRGAKFVSYMNWNALSSNPDVELPKFLELMRDCDILIGIHGAGLANAIFLDRHAMLVELRSGYGADTKMFRVIAYKRQLMYFAADIEQHGQGEGHTLPESLIKNIAKTTFDAFAVQQSRSDADLLVPREPCLYELGLELNPVSKAFCYEDQPA